MDKNYLTIQEYADYKGVSYQAIYKRLKTTFKPYVVEVDGRKYLKKSILADFPLNHNLNQVQPEIEPGSTSAFKPNSTPSQTAYAEEFLRLNLRNEEIIDSLRAELKEKDNQIKEQNEHIVELSNKLAVLFENNQKLQLNYQLLLSDGKMNDNEDERMNTPPAHAPAHDADDIQEPKEEQKKKSFFQRLFNL